MGRDKALLPFEGVPMAARVADTLRTAGCSPVQAIGGDAAGLAALGLEVVPDGWPGEGPAGGVLTALAHWPDAEAVVVVSCDVPRLTPGTVQAVMAALAEDPVSIAAVAVTDRVEPLCAAWRPAARRPLLAAFEAGERRMRSILEALPWTPVEVAAQDLRNVNAAGDLRQ
jgi:molybdenum cofactor guanylyltransferase